MIKRKLVGLVALLSVVLLLGLTACSPADVQSLKGILKNIDSLSGNVTVTLKDGSTTTFNLANINLDTIINTQGDLSFDIGDNITIKINRHGKVTGLEVRKAEADGVIKSLGTDNVTITTIKNGDITLKVTPETLIITKSQGRGALSDLKVGQNVEARYDIATMKALKIKVDFQKNETSVRGTIKTVYSNNSTITIATENKGDITLQVTPETMIRIGGKGVGVFSDLQVAQRVEARYDITSLKALKLSIDSHEENQKHEDNQEHRDNQGNKGNQGGGH